MTRVLPYDRAQRVADEIHQILSTALINEISDPRLSGVSITRVSMTKDLRIARIHYYVDGASEGQKDAARRGLGSAVGFFKRSIGDNVRLKFMPEIEFYYDDSIDFRERMDELIAGKDSGERDG